MKALVTGATGFVGAAVARALSAAGWQVRVLARSGSNRSNLQSPAWEVVEGDLADLQSLERALEGCTGLFHAAADYRLGARDPTQLYRTNVEGTRRILSAARTAGVTRIVYTSSVATIGIPSDGSPGDERTPVAESHMIGHYKRSKYLAEEVARDAARTGMSVVIVNPSTPVGPGDIKPTPTGQLVLDAASGRMPAYVDTGLNIVHVDDVAAGHLLAFERDVADDSRADRAPRRARAPAQPSAVCRGVARCLSCRRLRQNLGPQRPRDARRSAHVAQAHVLLERQGSQRAGVPLASAPPGVRGCVAVVSRARPTILIAARAASAFGQMPAGSTRYANFARTGTSRGRSRRASYCSMRRSFSLRHTSSSECRVTDSPTS